MTKDVGLPPLSSFQAELDYWIRLPLLAVPLLHRDSICQVDSKVCEAFLKLDPNQSACEFFLVRLGPNGYYCLMA